jgi:hypothetical protein
LGVVSREDAGSCGRGAYIVVPGPAAHVWIWDEVEKERRREEEKRR